MLLLRRRQLEPLLGLTRLVYDRRNFRIINIIRQRRHVRHACLARQLVRSLGRPAHRLRNMWRIG
jgi:hypothetical protein